MFIPEKEYNLIISKMPILCVDLLIIHNKKCLLLKRNDEPAKGQYWFPGGRVLKNELIKDAAIRKAKEETNLDCEFKEIVSIEETIFEKSRFKNSDVHTVNVCCYLKPTNIKKFNLDKNHSDFKWINKQNKLYHEAVNRPLSLIGFNEIE